MSIGLITRFKNERHILYEWVHHHFDEGIDKIYLINDNSDDNFLENNLWLNEYIDIGRIVLLKSKSRKQKDDYNNFIKLIKNNKWIIQLDMDEFIFTPQKKQLKLLLNNELNNYDYIRIKWKLFSHRCLEQPKSVIENNIFTHKSKKDPTSPTGIKCIGKTENIIKLNIHEFSFNKKINQLKLFNSHNNLIQLNHYKTQSDEYLYGVKEQRGGGVNKDKYKCENKTHIVHKLFDKECLILKDKRKDLIKKCNMRGQIKPQIYKNSSWYNNKIKNINKNNEDSDINTI